MSRLFLLLIAGLKFGKLFGTVGTMLISMGVYALLYGWRYAVGIIAMLFIHEMGHYLAARQRGLGAQMPIFIPFLALTRHEAAPDAETQSYIALAGPLLGTVGAIGAWFLARDTGSTWIMAVACSGFFLNLINLIPLPPLDGGLITAVLSPRIWLLGVPIIGVLMWFHFSAILMIIAIVAAPHVWAAIRFNKDDPANAQYFAVAPKVRWEYGLMYIGLIAFLAYMVNDLDKQLPHGRRTQMQQSTSQDV